ncbi:MAG: hypothetical protein P8Z67_08175 [Gammaproteobacteria bacterium]
MGSVLHMRLDRQAICEMLPHGESMCLLDQVQGWDRQHIVCVTNTHRAPTHPLRTAGGLPMVALLEYGAQAMAVHGCLLAQSGGARMQEGYLAALRDVRLADGWLSDVNETLRIKAEQIFHDGGNMVYTLTIQAQGRVLTSARLTAVGRMVQDKHS